jgi:hypothetical protein
VRLKRKINLTKKKIKTKFGFNDEIKNKSKFYKGANKKIRKKNKDQN